MSHLPTQESFLKDVAEHKITILNDNGIYRHIRCAKPGTSDQHFEIVTWSGYLAYVGDMGAFTFWRLRDMFEFFRRSDRHEDSINPRYWAEKLEAVDRPDGYETWSPEAFSESVNQYVTDFLDNNNEWPEQVKQALREEVIDYVTGHNEDEHEAVQSLRDFDFKYSDHEFSFDIDDWLTTKRYTCRFIWCCYAIVHAIKLYDTLKSEQANQQAA